MNKSPIWLIAMLTLLCMQAQSTGQAQTNSDAVGLTIVYTGRILGELEPCGCTAEGDLGGARRLATELARLRDEDPELVLLSPGGLLSSLQTTHEITNGFLLEAAGKMRIDAIGVQWSDLIYGPAKLQSTNLPWVASNWLAGKFAGSKLIERAGNSVAFFNWLAPEDSPHKGQPDSQRQVASNMDELSAALRDARAHGALTVVSAYGMREPATRLPMELIDLLILPRNIESWVAPVHMRRTIVLQPGSRGQRLGLVRLRRGTAGRWQLVDNQTISLGDSVQNDPSLDTWYQAYTAALAVDYNKRAERAQKTRSKGNYLGTQACKTCHQKETAHWRTTDHAVAFDSLQSVGKTFDANCVACHSVGFGKDGGFYAAQAKPDLRHVGCEVCHGAARPHVYSGGITKTESFSEGVCVSCHNKSHSPLFDVRTYLPRVLHKPRAPKR